MAMTPAPRPEGKALREEMAEANDKAFAIVGLDDDNIACWDKGFLAGARWAFEKAQAQCDKPEVDSRREDGCWTPNRDMVIQERIRALAAQLDATQEKKP